MKIVLLTSSLDAGGAERVACTLCNQWVLLGYDVTLVATFSGGGEVFYPVSATVKVIYLADLIHSRKKTLASYLLRLFYLRRLIVGSSANVVVSFLPNVNVAAILACGFTKIPVIISERRNPASQKASYTWELACLVFYRFANSVVVQTESAKNNIRLIYPALKKVMCVPNPLPSAIKNISRNHKAESNLVLLSLGRLAPEKQIEHSIIAFAKLASSNMNWNFHIYGSGPSYTDLLALVVELNLQERIFFMGRTKTAWDVMANSDAFIMTSAFEGFPNTLMEAMGVGLPCLAYDCPSGPHELTLGGQDGILVPLNDEEKLAHSLQLIFTDGVLRSHLGQRARVAVLERYKLGLVLEKWSEVFRNVGVNL